MVKGSNRRRAGRRRWWPVPLFLIVLLGFLAWTGYETVTAMRAVDRATTKAQAATDALGAGDLPAALAHVRSAGEDTGEAARAADSIPMRVLGAVPWLGRDVRAARITVHSVDDALNDSVLPLLESVQRIKDAQDQAPEGTVAIAAIRAETPTVNAAAQAADQAYAPLAGIDPTSLVFLDSQVTDAQTRVGQLAGMSAQADSVLQLAPQLLGADQPRSYLLVFQNLSEERPTGGIFGSWALMQVDNGEVSLAAAGSNDIFSGIPVPWQTLAPADAQQLYGTSLDAHQNVNLGPDFPVAAQLVSSVWRQATGRAAPDGVIAVTPVALADALAATGPVTVAGGPELTTDNVVQVLQSEVYATIPDNNRRNAYLGQVTGTVFGQVLRSGLASPGLLQQLGHAASTGHIQAWFADPGTEALVADLPVGGVLPAEPDPDQVRLYFTNTEASKLGQFVTVSTATRCEAGAPQVEAALRYQPPAQPPQYVVGDTGGRHSLTVDLFVPPNRGVKALQVDGRDVGIAVGELKNWTVVRAPITLEPSTTTRLVWTLDGTGTTPQVQVQPLTTAPDLPAADTVGQTCG